MIVRRSNLGQDERGVSAVEFGIIALPLCICLMGFMDLGYQLYVRAVLQGSLNDVARAASVESPRFGDTRQELQVRVQTALTSQMNELARGSTLVVQVKNYQDFTGVGRPEKLTTDKDSDGRYDAGDDCWQDSNPNRSFDTDQGRTGFGGADDIVFYNVNFSMPRLFPMAGLLGASSRYSIDAQTAVRNQPYANQRVPEIRC